MAATLEPGAGRDREGWWVWQGSPVVELLERDRELHEIAGALDRLGRGQGGLVLVQGAAGIGKTALLDAACAPAAGAGVRVLRAGAGELEQEFPYGIVRQLFEPPLRAADPDGRRRLLDGAAEPAASVVAPDRGRDRGPDGRPPARRSPAGDAYIVLHGLYWLTVNLAAAGPGPLLLVVDDVHWVDSPSLRFLQYLARRLPGLPVLVLLAARPDEPEGGEPVLSRLAADGGARLLCPAPLTPVGVADLVDRAFGEPPAERFVTACHAATAGNPFLVREMAAALASDGIRPVAEAAGHASGFGPARVARSTMVRLAKLPAAALPLARAVAVLGADARPDRAIRLAQVLGASRLTEPAATEAIEALVRTGILGPGRPLAFVHPIVRAAIHQDMSATARSAAHARAAQLLAAGGTGGEGIDGDGTDGDRDGDGIDLDAIAGHLLLTEPCGSTTVVDQLRAAARHARDRGAPGSAAVYLRRALDEAAPTTPRGELVLELALAEKLSRDQRALDRLREALDLAVDPAVRSDIVCELSEALAAAGRWEPAMQVLEAVPPTSGGITLRMETQYATGAAWDPRRVGEFDRRLPRLRTLVDEGGPAARRLTLVLAAIGNMRGDPAPPVLDLVRRGLDGGRFVADEGPDVLALQLAGSVLVNTEQLDEALELAGAMVAEARARGSAYGFVNGVLLRARASTRTGDLVATEADLRTALEVAQEHDLVLGVGSILLYGADAWTERDELADLAAMAGALVLPPELDETPIGMVVAAARGRARLLAGDTAGAADDLRRVGGIAEAVRFRNPNALSWRSPLALALVEGEPDEARRLAEDELAQARTIGEPRAIGIALRTLGVVAGPEDGLDHLREAIDVLDTAPAGLEQARVRIELGAALRRSDQPTAAHAPLRAGLDRALRLGATRLATRAEAELASSGAEAPDRPPVDTGAGALTPTEQRIAAMAEAGMRPAEIAQALFVSLNTVETHLRQVARKRN
jgi:DNA-binding CsgD family transcriptional regulator